MYFATYIYSLYSINSFSLYFPLTTAAAAQPKVVYVQQAPPQSAAPVPSQPQPQIVYVQGPPPSQTQPQVVYTQPVQQVNHYIKSKGVILLKSVKSQKPKMYQYSELKTVILNVSSL